ncbi:kinase-like domain-containing protein [Parasitella parasitica]|nr:kinase-like domain-containing protein [Parasitella parasitica]
MQQTLEILRKHVDIMESIYEIKVTEFPIVVKDTNDESWKTVPEFNIIVKTSHVDLYIIRYIPDLYSFDHLIKTHYQKIKIPLPTLSESISKAEKRMSIRSFFHMSMKSNAEKVEKYLYRCSMDPVLKNSTLLRDFFSPQREGDLIKEKSHVSATTPSSFSPDSQDTPASYSPQLNTATLQDSIIDSRIDVGKVWVPSPHPSVISLPNSINTNHDDEQQDDDDDDDNLFDMLSKSTDHYPHYHQDTFPLDHLEMIKVLGKGCMGKVVLVRSQITKELYALKSIVKEHVIDQREITHTLDERNILARLAELNHPYLAKLHASFQDEHRLYLLTNYYCGGDLATHMARLYNFTPECALFYAAEIIDGIGELHRLGVLYRDLKPENILLSGDGHIILTDFGLSKWLTKEDDYSTQTFCGTAEYLAPEVLLGEAYSFTIDYWSFGTILYEMLAGITPFWADNHSDMYQRVLNDALEFPADIFDYETAEFLSDVLDRDPRTRLGAQGVEEIKNHVYFADITWDDIRNRRLQPPYLPPVTDELDFTNFDPDFLAMSPALTPVPSEVEFSDEVQDIFDGYSFTDERYFELEQPHVEYNRSHHQDGFYQDDSDQEEQEEQEEHGEQEPPLFQPARKRGSISMLSNVDTFCLNDDVLVKPSFAKTPFSPSEEHVRYAKRRNTSGSDTNQQSEQQQQQQQQQATLAVMSYPIVNENPFIPDTVSSFEDLEFSKLPDLRLSFNIQQDQQKQQQQLQERSASTKPSKPNTGSKTRRFFSLLL